MDEKKCRKKKKEGKKNKINTRKKGGKKDLVKEVIGGVGKLEFGAVSVGLLDANVFPKLVDLVSQVEVDGLVAYVLYYYLFFFLIFFFFFF